MAKATNFYLAQIEAFTIFSKYEHEEGMSSTDYEFLAGPDPDIVSEEDKTRLSELGWFPHEEECFYKLK